MKLFKVSAKINGKYKYEIIKAKYHQQAIDIFKERHLFYNTEDLECQLYPIWGWIQNGRRDTLVE